MIDPLEFSGRDDSSGQRLLGLARLKHADGNSHRGEPPPGSLADSIVPR